MRQFIDYGRYPATFASEPVSTRAWFCTNPEDLLLSAPQRRNNLQLGGRQGRLARRTYDEERTVDLLFEMIGDCDPDGTPYDDLEAGLAANKRLFTATYFRADRDPVTGEIDATIEDLDGTSLAGGVQLDAPIWGKGLTECSFTMSVTIARGELLEVGS